MSEPGPGVIDIRSTGNEIVPGGNEAPPTVAASKTNANATVTSTRTPTSTQTPTPAVSPSAPPSSSPGPLSILLMVVHALFYCYLIGVCLFGAHFILQIAVLCRQSCTQPVIRDGRYRIVETGGNRAPCSFGKNIFINPGLYDPETYQQILIHEKIHVSGRHTLDILAAEMALVLQWFNPFIWLYRREVENNLEFLTDQSVLLHRGVERFAYQLSLLRVSAPHLPFSITNNYSQSLLKRRIVMMNSQRSPRQSGTAVSASSGSSKSSAWRDTTVRPASRSTNAQPVTPVSASEAIPAQSAQPESWPSSATQPEISLQPQISLRPVISLQPQLQEVMNIDLAPVVHLDIDMHMTGDSAYREGSWFVTSRGDELEFELRAGNDEHNWESSFTVRKDEFDPFPGQGTVTFKLVREAGTMNFKGQFDGQQGFGHFEFQPHPAYFQVLKQMGVEDLRGLVSMKAQHITPDFIKGFQDAGLTNLPLRTLLSFKANGITPEYARSFHDLGYTDIETNRLVSLKSMGVDAAYVARMKEKGFDSQDLRKYMRLKQDFN